MHVERAFVICLHFFLAVYGVRTGNRCVEGLTRFFTVQLQCPAGEWIYVEHEAYGVGDATTCRLKSADSCSKLVASSQYGLVVNCNGKQSCREAMQVHPIKNCNITDAAEVKYNCIKGSMNMCTPVTTTVNGSAYLHSPGFPDSVGVNSSCVVRITGQTLQVTLLEERMRSGMLIISGDGRQLWTNVNVNQYNRVLPGQAGEILIVYHKYDQDGSNLWIRIADSGQMNVTISREILGASTTATPTQRLPGSQTTSSPSTSDAPTTETAASTHSTATVAASFTTVTSTHGHTTHSTGNIATQWPPKSTTLSTTVSTTDTSNIWDVVTALSVVCGILMLIIVVLVIYFMVVKPFRKKHNTSLNTGTPVRYVETNVYDGVQRNTSDAGDEHKYGHITSSEGPCYANIVSGGDPYVNT